MKQKKSIEDYLKTIYILTSKGKVRGIDIARRLNVSRATVCNTLKDLEQEGFVQVDEQHSVFLTEQGLQIARETYERNQFFQELLIGLGVDQETAFKDACEMEHSVSTKSFLAIRAALEQKRK